MGSDVPGHSVGEQMYIRVGGVRGRGFAVPGRVGLAGDQEKISHAQMEPAFAPPFPVSVDIVAAQLAPQGIRPSGGYMREYTGKRTVFGQRKTGGQDHKGIVFLPVEHNPHGFPGIPGRTGAPVRGIGSKTARNGDIGKSVCLLEDLAVLDVVDFYDFHG